jgi:hypothetical protein
MDAIACRISDNNSRGVDRLARTEEGDTMAAKFAAVRGIKNKSHKRAVVAARLEWWRTKHYLAFPLADDDMTAPQHTAPAASRRVRTGGRHGLVR